MGQGSRNPRPRSQKLRDLIEKPSVRSPRDPFQQSGVDKIQTEEDQEKNKSVTN